MDALRGEETGMGRREQLARLARAITLAPKRAWYRETHAIYSIDVKDYGRARADVDTAIQLADRPYLRYLRGLVSCQLGEYEASLPDFDRAIAEQPKNAQFYRGRSLARSHVGRYADALEDARHLVTMAPQQGESHHALGVALAGMGKLREAVDAFGEALRRKPELIYPLRERAGAYRRLGEFARASEDSAETIRKEREESGDASAMDPFRY